MTLEHRRILIESGPERRVNVESTENPAENAKRHNSSTPDLMDINETTRRLMPRLAAGGLLALVVVTALALFGDTRELGTALSTFDWWLTAPVLVLILMNYLLRFLKWEIYLHQLDLPHPSPPQSGLVFLSAFSMAITPGKLGEVIKGVFLKRLSGTPVSQTTAVVATERITDLLGMLALASIGLVQFSYGRPILALAAIGTIALVLLLRRPNLVARIASRIEAWPLVGGSAQHAVAFTGATSQLMGPRLLLGTTLLSMLSWFGECLALLLILYGLGLDLSWQLLLTATFIWAAGSVFGAVSLLPGGLGVAEASVAGMLILLVNDPEITRSTAAAATLLIRFATLWFAVLLGLGALMLLLRVMRRAPSQPQPTPNAMTETKRLT